MTDPYTELTNRLYTELSTTGAPKLATLKAIDAARGTRPRPFLNLVPQWAYLGDGPADPLEAGRRGMVAAGLLPPTDADVAREAERARQHARHESERLAAVKARDEAQAAASRRVAILP